MSKFCPGKHRWRRAVEENLKGITKSCAAAAGKVSEFITKLIVCNHEREERLV